MGVRQPGFEGYFGAALLTCGIVWAWDYVASLFFPSQAALNLTVLSSFTYFLAGFIGAFALTRKKQVDQVQIGLCAGAAAFAVNIVFRMIVFEITEALWGVVIYAVFLIIGGGVGGFFARKIVGTKK
jgi:hypothetical protein